MINRIQLREFFAWTTLVVAIIIFSATLAFSQTKSISVDSDNGRVHIVIDKTENGKTVHIDTTFTITDDIDVEKIVDRLTEGAGTGVYISTPDSKKEIKQGKGKNSKKSKVVIVNSDTKELSKEEKAKLEKELETSMKDLDKNLKELHKSLNDLHIHIDSPGDNDFTFDFEMPEMNFDKNFGCYAYAFSTDDEGIDSLDTEDRIIFMGEEEEQPPVLEKVVTSKNGKQVFVFRRSVPEMKEIEKASDKSGKPAIHNVSYFPNPTTDKFTLKFITDKEIDVTISIVDANGKEVYSEALNSFDGEYSKEINLTGKSKGKYLLKISEGGKSITKKILLN